MRKLIALFVLSSVAALAQLPIPTCQGKKCGKVEAAHKVPARHTRA